VYFLPHSKDLLNTLFFLSHTSPHTEALYFRFYFDTFLPSNAPLFIEVIMDRDSLKKSALPFHLKSCTWMWNLCSMSSCQSDSPQAVCIWNNLYMVKLFERKTKPCIYWIVDFDNCLLQFSFWMETAHTWWNPFKFIWWYWFGIWSVSPRDFRYNSLRC